MALAASHEIDPALMHRVAIIGAGSVRRLWMLFERQFFD
jgi:hypothetical protein